MSFAFLPLYTGDYRRDTQHLTPLRHGIYLLLLFHCWDTRGPLPLDEQEQAGIANCRSADEIEALRYVVRRFFVCMEDGHYNQRMQREIDRAAAISTERSDAGRRGANARMQRFRDAQAIAKQVPSKCLASDATPTTTTTTTSTSTTTTTKPTAPAAPDLVPPEVWQAFRASRQALRAPLTPPAEVLLVAKLRRLQAEGHDPRRVVEQSIERGWKGVFAIDAEKRAEKGSARAQTNAAIWKTEVKDERAIDGTAERVD